ncbi:MAG: helix-turn-helix domain-containing protein [Ruminiclostridium sp.]
MINIQLRQLRRELNLTQDELAKKLKLTRSALSLYELGKRDPDTDTLNLLADFFDISVDYLLGRTDVRIIQKTKIKTKPLHNLDVSTLTEEAVKQVEEYIEFVKQKYAQMEI